jgi:hypothetical protein
MAMTELFSAHVLLFNQEVAGLWIDAAQRFNWGENDTENRPVNPFRYFHVERQKKNMPRMLTRVVLASVVIIFFMSYIALTYVRYQ